VLIANGHHSLLIDAQGAFIEVVLVGQRPPAG
jgi:hypothetical protein